MDIKIQPGSMTLSHNGKTQVKIFPYWSTVQLENDIAKIEFKKYSQNNHEKDKEFEKARLHPIAVVYYYLIWELGRVPSLVEVFKSYRNSYATILDNGKLQLVDLSGKVHIIDESILMARICRAYNSYHRELHLLISLWEYGMNAHYSLAQDIEKGIDVAITYHGTQYGIRSCIDSEYSNAFCKKKEEGRHLYKNSEIVFPARLRNNAHGPCNVKYVGDAALYRKEAVWDFLSLLEDTSA